MYDELIQLEHDTDVREIVDMAKVIYTQPSPILDERVRDMFQRRVEKSLRALMNDEEWRRLLRNPASGLAADMFQLVGTLLLEGAATNYPPQLPQAKHPGIPFELGPTEELNAIVVRDYDSNVWDEMFANRGEMLSNCRVEGERVWGMGQQGQAGYVPLDYVIFGYTGDNEVGSDTDDHRSDGGNDARGFDHVLDHEEEGAALMSDHLDLPRLRRGRKDKASWVLGMDDVMDVFGISTPKVIDEKGIANGEPKKKGILAKLDEVFRRRSWSWLE